MTTASEVIIQVQEELNDDDKVTWDDADMLRYINAAQLQVVLVRPDANSVIENVTLTPGNTRHSLASGQLRLLDVIRNMGADGLTPGRPIRMVDRASHDLFNRNWHSAVGKTVIREVMYNEKVPAYFYTDPAAHAITAVTIEVAASKAPTDVADVDAGVLGIADIYQQPVRQYMLHMAFAKEVESRTSVARSRGYLQDFYNSLGIKTKVDAMYSPSKEVKPNV